MSTDQHTPDTQDATVVYLPSAGRGQASAAVIRAALSTLPSPHPSGAAETPDDDQIGAAVEVADEVLDAELVPESENPAIDAQLRQQRMLQLRQASAARAVVITRRVREAERPKKAAGRASRGAVRHAFFTARGHASWAKRASDALTHGVVRRQIKIAEISGDKTLIAEWTDRLNTLKDARKTRAQELPKTVWALVRAGLIVITVLAGILLVTGLAVQLTPGGGDFVSFFSTVGAVLAVMGEVMHWALLVGLWGALPALLAAAWREGRRAVDRTPGWMLTPAQRLTMDTEVTSGLITQALANMGERAINKLVKAGQPFEFVTGPRSQGDGTFVQVRLPIGITASKLIETDKKVELLAGNLGRFKHEVWPSTSPEKGADARVLDLWIADKGALDKPVPPSPLVNPEFGAVDVHRDTMPWGLTPRGDSVDVGMLRRHWLVSGVSKQGKTASFRSIALWLALDPCVELRIADLKGVGDWAMFEGIATTLIQGSQDRNVVATCEMLEAAVAEMNHRMERWLNSGGKGDISREISRKKGSGFHPLYVFVDEVQVLYGHGDGIGGSKDDARAWRAAKAIHDQGRAVDVHLLQATQRPTDRTLPVLVREGAHVRASLFVPNESTARMALGDVADMGARPQSLRQGTDAGTVVLTGADDVIPQSASHVITRTHYISTDAAYGVAGKAKEIRKRAGRELVVDDAPEEIETRDLLTDAAATMRDGEKVRSSWLLQQLKEQWPDYYGDHSAQQFAAALKDAGVEIKTRSVDGTPGQRAVVEADVLTAIEVRNEAAKQDDTPASEG
jgi:S-DNA-T family DNA segregation ATPase FtsK/SpoIIIE